VSECSIDRLIYTKSYIIRAVNTQQYRRILYVDCRQGYHTKVWSMSAQHVRYLSRCDADHNAVVIYLSPIHVHEHEQNMLFPHYSYLLSKLHIFVSLNFRTLRNPLLSTLLMAPPGKGFGPSTGKRNVFPTC